MKVIFYGTVLLNIGNETRRVSLKRVENLNFTPQAGIQINFEKEEAFGSSYNGSASVDKVIMVANHDGSLKEIRVEENDSHVDSRELTNWAREKDVDEILKIIDLVPSHLGSRFMEWEVINISDSV